MASAPILFETTFNTYSVRKVIGEGGSGRVFAVNDDEGKEYALKCLFPERVTTERRKRFKNEVAFCTKTQHANIIRVLDSGLAEWKKTKCPFYVMPLYPVTLRALIDEKIRPGEVLPLFNQILDGVEAAHLQRVFHRDLKPENILCDGTAKQLVVADFGIAHFEEDLVATLIKTPENAKMANLGYSAPEQRIKGSGVDHRADIFALGLILNEMFTGSVPYGTGYKSITAVAPDFAYLDPLVERLLQQDAAARFDSIGSFKKELIGRGNEFVVLQQLDSKRREVLPTSVPPSFEPVQLMGVDWFKGRITFMFNRTPEPGWVNRFQNPRGSWSSLMGAGPENIRFHGDKAYIDANERHAQDVVNHCKEYVRMANVNYEQELQREAKQREAAEREKLARDVQEEETRARLLKHLRI